MFTPLESALGAALIQAATSAYIHLEGKTIGFSSILYNSVFRPSIHSISILLGLFCSTKFVTKFLPSFAPPLVPAFSSSITSFYGSPLNFLTAGLIVGFGTSAGCGCTSGHMLTGMSRLRWRSFVATCTFFATGVITTMVTGNYAQINPDGPPSYLYDSNFTQFKENKTVLVGLLLAAQLWSYVVLPQIGKLFSSTDVKENKQRSRVLGAVSGVSSGFLFGCGLYIAGMTDAAKVTGFLSFLTPHNFDPSLAMIPLFCIIPNIILWKKWLPQNKEEATETSAKDAASGVVVKKPVFADKYDLNFSDQTDAKFILGNALFGIGWGLAGVCPGPAILSMSTEVLSATFGRGCLFIISFLAGSFIEKHSGN